jgi:Uma2 family endonuclease
MGRPRNKLITAEDFFGMPEPPDGSPQELVRGEIITWPLPGARHGVTCSRINCRLGNYVDDNHLGTTACNGTGFICERGPDTVRAPDISFWSRERLLEVPEGYIDIPPDLAVDVLSPHDKYARIEKKVQHCLNRGVRLVWVVDPQDRSVILFRPGKEREILEGTDTLTCEDVLPGFRCRVADLFP